MLSERALSDRIQIRIRVHKGETRPVARLCLLYQTLCRLFLDRTADAQKTGEPFGNLPDAKSPRFSDIDFIDDEHDVYLV